MGGLVTGFAGRWRRSTPSSAGGSRELRALKRELEMHRLLRKAMHGFAAADYARVLDLVADPGVLKAIGGCTRDEAVCFVARAALARPRLAALLLRSVIAPGARVPRSDGAIVPLPPAGAPEPADALVAAAEAGDA